MVSKSHFSAQDFSAQEIHLMKYRILYKKKSKDERRNTQIKTTFGTGPILACLQELLAA